MYPLSHMCWKENTANPMLMVVERWGLCGMIGQGSPGVTGYQGSGFTVIGHFFSGMCAPFHCATPITHPEAEQLDCPPFKTFPL